MALFWMLAALISLDFKKRVVEKAAEKDSKHDEKQENMRKWKKARDIQLRKEEQLGSLRKILKNMAG